MSDEKRISIAPEVVAFEAHHLAEFYRNRTMAHSQRIFEADLKLDKAAKEIEAMRKQLQAATQPDPIADNDRTLAILLRGFIENDNRSQADVELLVSDALRIISSEVE